MAGPAMTAGRADMAQLQRRRASGSRYSPDPETMAQRKQIWLSSGDTGTEEADTAQIQRQWASVSGYSPDPETINWWVSSRLGIMYLTNPGRYPKMGLRQRRRPWQSARPPPRPLASRRLLACSRARTRPASGWKPSAGRKARSALSAE